MIVPDAIPAVSVCGAVLNTAWVAVAATTVSCCAAEDSPAAVAVIVGVPAAVSEYWKLAVLDPAGIVNDEGVNVPLAEVELRLTVTALEALTGLPEPFSNATVIVPEVVPAVRVCGDVVKPSSVRAASTLILTFAGPAAGWVVSLDPLRAGRVEIAVKLPTPPLRLPPAGTTALGSLL